jgi:hypothetical protein
VIALAVVVCGIGYVVWSWKDIKPTVNRVVRSKALWTVSAVWFVLNVVSFLFGSATLVEVFDRYAGVQALIVATTWASPQLRAGLRAAKKAYAWWRTPS